VVTKAIVLIQNIENKTKHLFYNWTQQISLKQTKLAVAHWQTGWLQAKI